MEGLAAKTVTVDLAANHAIELLDLSPLASLILTLPEKGAGNVTVAESPLTEVTIRGGPAPASDEMWPWRGHEDTDGLMTANDTLFAVILEASRLYDDGDIESCEVTLTSGACDLTLIGITPYSIKATDSLLCLRSDGALPGRVDELRIHGRVIVPHTDLRVAVLTTDGATLATREMRVTSLECPSSEATLTSPSLRLRHYGAPTHVAEPTIILHQVSENLHIELETAAATVSVHGSGGVKKLAVSGGGRIAVGGGSTINGLASLDAPLGSWLKETPRLRAGPYSTVLNVEGHFCLEDVSDSIIAGVYPTGFEFCGLENSEPGALKGAVIENVYIGDLYVRGRALWAQLAQAAIVIPTQGAAALAGVDVPSNHEDEWDRQRLRALAAATREMAGVADSHGAPGSIRSLANWNAYNLRRMTVPSSWERWLLWLYRLIGYGERPGPALGAWLAAVIVVTGINLWGEPFNPSVAGLRNVWDTLAFWAVPSFGLVNLPELPDGTNRDVNTFLIHAVLAVPFVTGVLALRNFVKADRPNR